jgi:hypothetical protein
MNYNYLLIPEIILLLRVPYAFLREQMKLSKRRHPVIEYKNLYRDDRFASLKLTFFLMAFYCFCWLLVNRDTFIN